MSKCKETQEILVNWSFGTPLPGDLDRDHIETCSQCRQLLEQAEFVEPMLQIYREQIDQQAEKLLEDRRKLQSADFTSAQQKYSGLPYWLKIAASIILVVVAGVVYSTYRSNGLKPAYLTKMDELSSRKSIQSYVGKTELFLMTLFSSGVTCGENDEGVLVNRELAQKLIYQKRLLDPQLSSDEFRDLKPVLDQLEFLLLDITGTDGCIRPEELELWRKAIQSRSTLLKVNLLQMEDRI
jgi:hypothetical protein